MGSAPLSSAGEDSAQISKTTASAPTTAINYGTPLLLLYHNQRMNAIQPVSYAGGLPTAFSISPQLPSGLKFNEKTGVLSGTPTDRSFLDEVYTIYAGNTDNENSGMAAAATKLEIHFLDAPGPVLQISAPNVILANQSTVNFSAVNFSTSTGGTPTQYAIAPNLPSGLQFDPNSGLIVGTLTDPSIDYAQNQTVYYTVNAWNQYNDLSALPSAILSITYVPQFLSYTYTVSHSGPKSENNTKVDFTIYNPSAADIQYVTFSLIQGSAYFTASPATTCTSTLASHASCVYEIHGYPSNGIWMVRVSYYEGENAYQSVMSASIHTL